MSASLPDAKSVGAAADGSVWAVTQAGQVFHYDGTADRWQPVAGELMDIAVGSAGNVWGVTPNGEVRQYVGGTDVWKPVFGALVQISASPTAVWGVNAGGLVYQHVENATWNNIPCDVPLTAVAVSDRGVWGLTRDMQIRHYQGGNQWAPVPGALVQISAPGTEAVPAGTPGTDLWGVNAGGDVYRLAGGQWKQVGSGLKQIAVGSHANAWAIDANNAAICLTAPDAGTDAGEETWLPGNRKRWDSKDKFDDSQSTHLWIVNRAAEAARADNVFGERIYQLVEPGATPGHNQFHDGLCWGLWDADEADPYRNSTIKGDSWFSKLSATYKSHFYDPASGKNWLGETAPTALTEGRRFFADSLDQYKNGNVRAAGYMFGLALHYLTDVTQPMHAANFTYLSSYPPGYHSAVETLAIKLMRSVQIGPVNLSLHRSDEPGDYIRAAATAAKPRVGKICSGDNLDAWHSEIHDFFAPWKTSVTPEVKAALIDGVSITAPFLLAWMRAAASDIPPTDPRLFTRIYSGPARFAAAEAGEADASQSHGGHATFWAIDRDGHLFHRIGWSGGWVLVNTPGSVPVVSLSPGRDDGSVHVVTPHRVWRLSPDNQWNAVYPRDGGGHAAALDITVLDRTADDAHWALDSAGKVYVGQGSLHDVSWTDVSAPAPLTSLSALSRHSAWGASAAQQTAWEYADGQWHNRGSGVVHVSVDGTQKVWGISGDGAIVTYERSVWQTPPEFGGVMGHEMPPDWGPLAWLHAGRIILVVDREGTAWAPSPLANNAENPWLPLG